ncbi:hypothetical protein D9758_008191 [Tetrapyrgos nigripes]|uniref:NAD-dependent epimerase/dehydratase domain-containing protein n=1 Tax=Tetrapyrgos nigripes TaxID=182062 RepID=A0A8H5LPS8_9AGAR|nr:hypothetical protein D9758_008191 [Tetrapyrgos nigripes]
MSKPIILVTGGTGLLGSHVIAQLLATNEYIVRGTARSAKKLRDIFPNEPRLEVVEVPDSTSDHTEALKGIEAVMHLAAPIYSKAESGEALYNGVYEGAVHIIKQAIDAGIKKIVYTGTYAALFELLNEKSFGNVKKGEFNFKDVASDEASLMPIYIAAKIIADKDIWDIAHQHPDVDITVLLPPAIFGPVVPNFPLTSRSNLSTNDYVYQLVLNGPDAYPAIPVGDLVDVRDMARAHVVALTTKPIPGKDKRFIVSGGKYNWKELADLVRRERPELAHKLPREDLERPVQTTAPIDLTFTEKELGFSEYYPWEETVLAALDSGLMLEKGN